MCICNKDINMPYCGCENCKWPDDSEGSRSSFEKNLESCGNCFPKIYNDIKEEIKKCGYCGLMLAPIELVFKL